MAIEPRGHMGKQVNANLNLATVRCGKDMPMSVSSIQTDEENGSQSTSPASSNTSLYIPQFILDCVYWLQNPQVYALSPHQLSHRRL